jgi:hypothetical protein
VKTERRLHTQLSEVARLDAALVRLALVWPDAEWPRVLARALTEAHAGRVWVMEDYSYEGRTYPLRSPLYLPRRSWGDVRRFRRAHKAAVAFIRFADRQLERDAAERMRGLVAGLRPPPAPYAYRSPRTLTSVQVIRSEADMVEATEELNRTLERIGRRFFGAPPPATT